jgi:hypothetical protein
MPNVAWNYIQPVSEPKDIFGIEPGKLPARLLRDITGGGQLHWLAAAAWNAMVEKAQSEGVELNPITPGDTYRTYQSELEVFVARYSTDEPSQAQIEAGVRTFQGKKWYKKNPSDPSLSIPGSSKHNLGLAIDVRHIGSCIDWLIENIQYFGFSWEVVPEEPWHIRYWRGDKPPPLVTQWMDANNWLPPISDYEDAITRKYRPRVSATERGHTGSDYENIEDSFQNRVFSAPLEVGNLSSTNLEMLEKIRKALAGEYNRQDEDDISFDTDELQAHSIVHMMPIIDPKEEKKIPAMLTTALGVNFGYIDNDREGRFYLTADGVAQKKSGNLKPATIQDGHSDPSSVLKNNSVPSGTAFAKYNRPYSYDFGTNIGPPSTGTKSKPNTTQVPETMVANSGAESNGSVSPHWEKMLVDTSYRDISGRMIRAFPTYMLWLIDEGGYFAGVKLFDNFYGLQSIIDFSIVSSEDLLGDTLVFRVSNLYSKLSKKEGSAIFNPNLDRSGDPTSQDNPGITEGLSSIIDVTLNRARNILSHMRNEYVVDVENIRLRPGVRVHLRGGYGANPNSLQTLFNGIITDVQHGEIVTVTAQSDAIELGAVVNSTNKKGDSGKIDGGINTGLWLSEPRDLMVRLLSMGTSRFREGIAYATRGLVFSENRFGIRHFGSIVYEPMTIDEEQKHQARIDSISDAYKAVGNFDFVGGGKEILGLEQTGDVRVPVVSLWSQLWSNFSQARDFEIFKRNIYPGNGTGIAQFLGGDLGDGWTSVSSITPSDQPNERLEYLSRLTDRSWNGLVEQYGKNNPDAKQTLEDLTSTGESRDGSHGAAATKTLLLSGIGLAVTPLAPVAGLATIAGGGLTSVLSGKGGNHIFNMLGLTSTLDDDMPGFDEVSFRAQTYMRSVWDLFQTCAKLLPNYIVAVRPFEDRSTVFYGKPHWLYTSGVMPITTGYPGDEKMAELGITKGPEIVDPDYDLSKLMTELNKNISPYADQDAFLRKSEPIEALQELSLLQQKNQSYFRTAGAMSGRVINFDSIRSREIQKVDEKSGKSLGVVAKLPKTKGFVTMGFHLPVKPKAIASSSSEDNRFNVIKSLGSDSDEHAQIAQLPTRFKYPFFTNKENSEYKLENYAFQFRKSESKLITLGSTGAYYEKVSETYGQDFAERLFQDIQISKELNLSPVQLGSILENSYSFTGNMGDISGQSNDIMMPFPISSLSNSSDEINYSEWEPPSSLDAEQFYIAMRWPYKPSTEEDQYKFAKKYFDGKISNLFGTVEDYQNTHVLIYNPTTNTAVVCKPAYFLWGKTSVATFDLRAERINRPVRKRQNQ